MATTCRRFAADGNRTPVFHGAENVRVGECSGPRLAGPAVSGRMDITPVVNWTGNCAFGCGSNAASSFDPQPKATVQRLGLYVGRAKGTACGVGAKPGLPRTFVLPTENARPPYLAGTTRPWCCPGLVGWLFRSMMASHGFLWNRLKIMAASSRWDAYSLSRLVPGITWHCSTTMAASSLPIKEVARFSTVQDGLDRWRFDVR